MGMTIYVILTIIGIIVHTVGVSAIKDEPEFSQTFINAGFAICTISNACMFIELFYKLN